MNRIFKSFALAIAALGVSVSVNAVTISASVIGETTSNVAGVTTVTFDGGNCAGYVSCTGDFAVVSGSSSGLYAAPLTDTTSYLSVPNPSQTTQTAVLSLGTTANYFGLFWGSIDTYNIISFFSGNTEVASYNGGQLPTLVADGNQTAWTSNRYINFDFGAATFDTVKIISHGYAFESDNHAFRKTAVPEPMTLLLMGVGLFGLVATRRFKRA
ncbi:MAG: PEP-CTERM sorting domain-containing protein [Moraxellaceae bacterium]|nr:MAG: PEP-CTERM sorting domain-containing protein [Moraxellaceae bacterium]